jgi:two-component sensor histidine kinase
MTELAAFAGIAAHMVQGEERLKASVLEQETLAREMSHRLKNMFSMALALIRASEKSSSTPAEMSRSLSGRMHALATASALVRRNFDDRAVLEGAELGEVVRKILQPHEGPREGSRFAIEGSPIRLGEHAVNGIALILHELATNAAKYGALKSDDGFIAVRGGRPTTASCSIG